MWEQKQQTTNKGDDINRLKSIITQSKQTVANSIDFNLLLFLRRYLVTTHFQPTSARSAFPCWDEPHYKARFKIAAVRQRDFVALSNMPLDNTEDVSIFWGHGLVSLKQSYTHNDSIR